MRLTEDERTNEVVQEELPVETPALDDIYVPGIGVRAALEDTGPEISDSWSLIAGGCARRAAFVNRWSVRTFGSLRRAGSRLVERFTRFGTEIQTAHTHWPRFPMLRANSTWRDLRQTRECLVHVVQTVVSRLRSALKNKLALSVLLTEAVARLLQETRSLLLRAAQIGSAQIDKATKHQRMAESPGNSAAMNPMLTALSPDLRLGGDGESWSNGARRAGRVGILPQTPQFWRTKCNCPPALI
jgi:hypothetical protein